MGIGLEEEEGKMCVSLSLSFEGCFFVRDVVGKSTSALFLSFFLSLRAVSAWSRSRGRTIDRGPGVRANDVFLVMMWDRLGEFSS